MAYEEIPLSDTESGKPTKQELFQKTRSNFIDHEDRLGDAEAALQLFYPIEFKVPGRADLYVPVEGAFFQRIPSNITLTSARIWVVEAGTAGTVEIDIQLKRGGGSFASIFSTTPTVLYSAGDYALSSDGVLSTTALLSGDILRVDLTTAQTDGGEFQIILTFEAAS